MEIKNCVIIGRDTIITPTEDMDSYVIIGNNITSLSRDQENMVFIGEKLILTKDVWESICKTLGI